MAKRRTRRRRRRNTGRRKLSIRRPRRRTRRRRAYNRKPRMKRRKIRRRKKAYNRGGRRRRKTRGRRRRYNPGTLTVGSLTRPMQLSKTVASEAMSVLPIGVGIIGNQMLQESVMPRLPLVSEWTSGPLSYVAGAIRSVLGGVAVGMVSPKWGTDFFKGGLLYEVSRALSQLPSMTSGMIGDYLTPTNVADARSLGDYLTPTNVADARSLGDMTVGEELAAF